MKGGGQISEGGPYLLGNFSGEANFLWQLLNELVFYLFPRILWIYALITRVAIQLVEICKNVGNAEESLRFLAIFGRQWTLSPSLPWFVLQLCFRDHYHPRKRFWGRRVIDRTRPGFMRSSMSEARSNIVRQQISLTLPLTLNADYARLFW